MPASKEGNKDIYANIGAILVEQSATDTLTFNELQTYISVFDKKALIINKIIYSIPLATWQELDAEADYIAFGISTANNAASQAIADLYNRADIVDYNHIYTLVSGTPADIERKFGQIEKDFSTMPGNGLLVPGRPLFGWMGSDGMSAAMTIAMRIFFTVKDVSTEEYWELVEATRVVN